MKNCYFMLSIHMSDNGIIQGDTAGQIADKEFFYDCIEQFNITEAELISINRSMRNTQKIHPKFPKKYDKEDIDYHKYLDGLFKYENHQSHHGCTGSI